ncbi:unnamed protein product [Rhodiola kirilowii]
MATEIGIRHYCCYKCRNLISLHDDIISRTFRYGHGRAYLFSHAKNIVLGPLEERLLITGVHTVADAFCRECGELLGIRYEKAVEERQKYKEGKFMIAKVKIDMEAW